MKEIEKYKQEIVNFFESDKQFIKNNQDILDGILLECLTHGFNIQNSKIKEMCLEWNPSADEDNYKRMDLYKLLKKHLGVLNIE